MDYQFPLVATNRDGKTRIFYDADTFRAFAFNRQVNGNVGGYWIERYEYTLKNERRLARIYTLEGMRLWNKPTQNDWIVRDNAGRVVDKEVFKTSLRTNFNSGSKWDRMFRRREIEVARAVERGGPIPYVGRGRRWRSSKKWTKNGRNGAHTQRKGIKLYEDPLIKGRDFDDL